MGERELGKNLPVVDQLHISRLAEARDLKFCLHIEGWGPNLKYAWAGHRELGAGSSNLLLIFGTPSYLE